MSTELIEKIKQGEKVKNSEDFSEYIEVFLKEEISGDRLNLYVEKMKAEKLGTLAAAKHSILKQVFAEYIQNSLVEANNAALEQKPKEAKKLVDQLGQLRSVFKNHDVINYKDFILESDEKMSDLEVELLFLEPELTTDEISKLSEAFLKAFGKKNIELSDKADYQKRFFNHPLIQCLDAYSDYKTIEKNVHNGVIELGNYKSLIKSILELREKINAEEYQGFITYVIHEDLNMGLSNILKNDTYKPKSLRVLLKEMTEGKEISHENLKNIMTEIKENHTYNVALNERKELTRNISSMFSLNDYGFKFNLPSSQKEVFFHGHATENSGSKQFEQQSNTANTFRHFGLDTIGLTLLKSEVTRTDHHSTFLREAKLSHLINLTKTEEIVLSGLQFDASHIKALSQHVKKEDDLLNGDFLSSNHYIVKSDIVRSQKIIENSLGKNDLELLCEKKNAYMSIIEKNKDLFKSLLDITSTNNQLSYQLLGTPLTHLTKALLKLEKNANITLFTGKDVELLQEVFSINTLNVDLADSISDCLEKLQDRREDRYKDIQVAKYQSLVNLGSVDNEKKSTTNEDNLPKEHNKILKRPYATLEMCIKYIEENPLNSRGYTTRYKNMVVNNLIEKINNDSQELLAYRSDKRANLSENIADIAQKLKDGVSMYFNKTDWTNTDSRYVWLKTLSTLLRNDGKTEVQKRNDLTLLNGLLTVAELSGSKIYCSNQELKKKLKP
jgi:DNA-binding ferritin-like protein (Dps family)